jgi:hypothetical protein
MAKGTGKNSQAARVKQLILGTKKHYGVDPIFRTPNGARMLSESGPWENNERSTRTSSSEKRCA